MKNKEHGFGLVGIIAILLVLAALIFAGWYVWNKNKEDKSAKPATSESKSKKDSTKAETLPAADTSDWVMYSNAKGDFSFKHPKSWVFASHPELCADGLVLFAANSASVGTCASEGFGQMGIGSAAGDHRDAYALSAGYKDVVVSEVTVHGVVGKKYVGTAESEDEEGMGVLPNGTVVTQYVFYTGGRTLTATYTQLSTYPNNLVDFNTLVMTTLNFSK